MRASVNAGVGSSFYELALSQMGWTFYKQELYENALQRFIALMDHKCPWDTISNSPERTGTKADGNTSAHQLELLQPRRCNSRLWNTFAAREAQLRGQRIRQPRRHSTSIRSLRDAAHLNALVDP